MTTTVTNSYPLPFEVVSWDQAKRLYLIMFCTIRISGGGLIVNDIREANVDSRRVNEQKLLSQTERNMKYKPIKKLSGNTDAQLPEGWGIH